MDVMDGWIDEPANVLRLSLLVAQNASSAAPVQLIYKCISP
jgi:hypothetical protein